MFSGQSWFLKDHHADMVEARLRRTVQRVQNNEMQGLRTFTRFNNNEVRCHVELSLLEVQPDTLISFVLQEVKT